MSDKRFPANIISSTAIEPTGSFEDSSASGTWSLQEAFTYVKAGLWPTAGNQKPLIEDVFSTYLYTGTNATQAITNGLDLAGEGGLVWTKNRDNLATETDHQLMDSEQGAFRYILESNTTNAVFDSGTSILTPQSDGFDLSSGSRVNQSGKPYVSWTWRKAPRFFDCVTYSGTGSAQTIAHNLGVAPGCVIVKSTTNAEDWVVYHRSLGGTYYGKLNSADLFLGPNTTVFNGTDATDSVFSVGTNSKSNGSGQTYVAYLFAHDPLGPSGDGSDGLIACGSYTGNGSTQSINLGWEPQFVIIKKSAGAGDEGWIIQDVMRGMIAAGSTHDDRPLLANSSIAEFSLNNIVGPTASGFFLERGDGAVNASGSTYIYIAIRRGPMRAPESGTEVFAVDNGDGSSVPSFASGFPVDFGMLRDVGVDGFHTSSRLTSGKTLDTYDTAAEGSNSNYRFDYQNGWFGSALSSSYYSWMFRRAPGFFDVVAYTGNGTAGRTVPHNLGVAPELMIVKDRGNATNWSVYAAPKGNTDALFLNLDFGGGTDPDYWNNTTPTDAVFTLGTQANVNGSSRNYIAYLFATLPGISKVGSYTGNGTNQTIDCGFTSGARFILIKRTGSTGDWYVWDSVRGIVAGNDPHLSLNTTAAEVTTDDSVDAESSGFIVNQDAGTNVNVDTASYIFLAIA